MQQLDSTVNQETYSAYMYEGNYTICQDACKISIRTLIIPSIEKRFDNQHTNHMQTTSLELHDLIFS